MPLKSVWVYHPRKYKQEINDSLIPQLSTFGDKHNVREFFELLKWKDSQQLVIWAPDHKEAGLESSASPSSDPLVAPFWSRVTRKLTSLQDPITGNEYEPLKGLSWWKSSYSKETTAKLVPGVQLKSILSELYFVNLNFKTVSEIIYQSNPSSLLPMVCYSDYVEEPKATAIHGSPSSTQDAMLQEDGWWISPDYDPYDVDEAQSDIGNE